MHIDTAHTPKIPTVGGTTRSTAERAATAARLRVRRLSRVGIGLSRGSPRHEGAVPTAGLLEESTQGGQAEDALRGETPRWNEGGWTVHFIFLMEKSTYVRRLKRQEGSGIVI